MRTFKIKVKIKILTCLNYSLFGKEDVDLRTIIPTSATKPEEGAVIRVLTPPPPPVISNDDQENSKLNEKLNKGKVSVK